MRAITSFTKEQQNAQLEFLRVPTITAFEQSPDLGQGLARDMPVCWAIEEVGQPYDVHLVSFNVFRNTIGEPVV